MIGQASQAKLLTCSGHVPCQFVQPILLTAREFPELREHVAELPTLGQIDAGQQFSGESLADTGAQPSRHYSSKAADLRTAIR